MTEPAAVLTKDPRIEAVLLPTSDGLAEVRRFTDAAIRGAVDRELEQLDHMKPGERGAKLRVRMQDGEVRVAIMARASDRWSLAYIGEREEGDWSHEAEVAWSWR